MVASSKEANRRAAAKFRQRHRERAREAVRRARERPAVIPDDAAFFSRPACPDCGQADPSVARTLERSAEVLVQRLRCRGCGKMFTAVFE